MSSSNTSTNAEKIKITYENSYMGDIKLAHMYVDNVSGKYIYLKFVFSLANMFHTTVEGAQDAKTKEYPLFLYPGDTKVYLTSFPIIDRYKSWKYNFMYNYSFADKPTESREIYDGVFFECFHMGFGSLIVALKNNNVILNNRGDRHVQVKINYTTLTNLKPNRIYDDYVDLYDLKILNELQILDKQEKTTYKYKYFVKKAEKPLTDEEAGSTLLSYYFTNVSKAQALVVERRELIPGVFGVLEMTKEGFAVLSLENNTSSAVIVHDLKVKGGEMTFIQETMKDSSNPQLVVFPNETKKQLVRIKPPKGLFQIAYDCKVAEGKVVEENEVKASLFVYGYYFKVFNCVVLAVKNNCDKAHNCYLFMKQLENCKVVTEYSDQHRMIVLPFHTKLYSSLYLMDTTKPFVYSYAYQISRVFEKGDTTSSVTDLKSLQNSSKANSSTSIQSVQAQTQANDLHASIVDKDLKIALESIENLATQSEVVKNQIASNAKFVDKDFPPQIEPTIYDSSFAGKRIENIKWARASEILGKSLEVFCDGIEPDDIKQGSLGDCWLLSAISSISSKPLLIERLFTTRVPNEAGIYEVNICVGGEWTRVIVDDFFPVNEWNNPVFAHNNAAELWVMLLEKAYAKVCGSYSKLISGFADEAFEDLTGCPTFSLRLNSKDPSFNAQNIWDELCECIRKSYFFCCATPNSPNCEKVGLISSHFYTLLDCKEALNGVKLVKLRNPWGGTEWKGDWCDDDTRWTKEAKIAFQHMAFMDDGVFYMPFQDFLNYFVSVVVCKYDPKFSRNQVKVVCNTTNQIGTFDDKTTYPIIEVKFDDDQDEAFFGIHQKDQRYKDGPKLAAGLGFIMLDSTGSVVGGCPMSSNRSSYTKNLTLKAGTYFIVPICHARENIKSYTISSHTTGKRTSLKLSELSCMTNGDHLLSLLDVYALGVKALGTSKDTLLKEAKANLTSHNWGTSMVFSTNHKKSVTVEMSVTQNNMVNAVYSEKFDLNSVKSSKLAWIGYCDSPRDGFSYSYSFAFSYMY
ncbi:hypothetical protein FDP41_011068 [Naegleria fowleri]|uniref:Calpain catalytic domain-containing protein n=1 Tax=Naegleria fowleri TaxID=5763 RepID=A0A6A5CBT3_NAEFO|nr:uncharacterized protein FDP41_011068 [Naegleria fowleri]KAF0983090.1 hypothetical protein FDP41_011068 [Naegleria fowleri]